VPTRADTVEELGELLQARRGAGALVRRVLFVDWLGFAGVEAGRRDPYRRLSRFDLVGRKQR
jgi:hypothetical protein